MSMDTRILHTKIFRDSYIRSLTDTEYRLFTYFVFNPHISQLGIYELEPEEIEFDLPNLTHDTLETVKIKFEHDKKIFFFNNWVGIANSFKYQKYTGSTNFIKQQKLLTQFTCECEPLLIKMYGSKYNDVLYKQISESKIEKKGDTPNMRVSYPYDTFYNDNDNNNNKFGKGVGKPFSALSQRTSDYNPEIHDGINLPANFTWDDLPKNPDGSVNYSGMNDGQALTARILEVKHKHSNP